MTIDNLIEKIKTKNPQADVSIVIKAYELADKAHEGQIRNSGEPYIIHPLSVADILVELGMDTSTVAAGILHDVVEDTEYEIKDIEKYFGQEVALLVDGVTKLSQIEYISKEERQLESYRKMFLAMAKDIRVILIKLADRLHNMRTLKHKSFWKQREIAKETLEIFAPLASRLGIFKVKWELEDLSFRYLEHDNYYYLVEQISMKRKEREEYINNVVSILKDEIIKKANINADISGRPKHFYSIYNKMKKKGKNLNEIYDLIAVRIIVDSVKDCYGTLGVIHTMWKPIPGRFKDYIAMPKPNLYQSLHTTVIGPGGDPFEIQIRTLDMHKTAEYGIAAHLLYKEDKNNEKITDKLTWINQIREWQTELQDSKEFMETLKIDLFSDLVFVFSPKGDVFELPLGSTPIDFAYRVHTEVGHRCIGSKVNGKIVPIEYQLQTGDIVEIMTSKQANGPSKDWIKIVKSSQAKNRIRQWFRREKKAENIIKGKELLEKELTKQDLDANVYTKKEKLNIISKKLGLNNYEDLFASIGENSLTANFVTFKIKDEFVPKVDLQKKVEQVDLKKVIKTSKKINKNSSGVLIKNADDIMVRFAKCCNPLPGDEIIGFITRGRGASVHRKDCPNVKVYRVEEPERLLEAAWYEAENNKFLVEIQIFGFDRPGLTTDIMLLISDLKINMHAINARTKKSDLVVNLTLEVKNLEELDFMIDRIRSIKDILSVHRITPSK